MNGFPEGDDAKGAVCARVHDIFPPQGNSGVSSGLVYIESGEFADEKHCWTAKTSLFLGGHQIKQIYSMCQ